MNYSMPEVVSQPVTMHKQVMHKPMPAPMPELRPMPEPMPMPKPMPQPIPAPAPMPAPMPAPRSMPVPAPSRATVQKMEVEKVEFHAETHEKVEVKAVKTHEAVLPLCARHMLWTHSLVISVVEGLPDVQVCSRRVAHNNNEMMEHFRPHLGKDAMKNISDLLNQNLVYIVQLAQSIKGGNQKTIAEAWGKVTQNADSMLTAACEAVPHFECEKLKKYYTRFLEMLKDEITFKVSKRMM